MEKPSERHSPREDNQQITSSDSFPASRSNEDANDGELGLSADCNRYIEVEYTTADDDTSHLDGQADTLNTFMSTQSSSRHVEGEPREDIPPTTSRAPRNELITRMDNPGSVASSPGRTERHHENPHPSADSSGRHVEPPLENQIVGSRGDEQQYMSSQRAAASSAVPETDDLAHTFSTAMELNPEAASLLPNSGVHRAATPMMEAEPVFAGEENFPDGRAAHVSSDIGASIPAQEPAEDPNSTVPVHDDNESETTPRMAVDTHNQPPSPPTAPAPDNNPPIPDAGSPSLHLLPTIPPAPDDPTTFSDTDSALGGMSYTSSLTSLTDSIYEAIEEHGRTYHSYKAGKYVLPNDAPEQARLDSQHLMFLLCNDGRLFLAPLSLPHVRRVLDIATGTGIWAIEFADDFPDAEVVGSDLSPIQPLWCPPNCRFEVDDAEDEWVWSAPFSYIHGRALLTCFADPADVVRKAYEALEPGGWLELQDATFPFDHEGPDMPLVEEGRMDRPYENPLQRWEQLALEAGIRGGRRWDNTRRYKQMLEQAGFVDVVEVRCKLPIGVWDGLTDKEKRIGAIHGPSIYAGLEGMSNRNLRRLDLQQEEIVDYCTKARAELATGTTRAHNWCYTVYGRRPE